MHYYYHSLFYCANSFDKKYQKTLIESEERINEKKNSNSLLLDAFVAKGFDHIISCLKWCFESKQTFPSDKNLRNFFSSATEKRIRNSFSFESLIEPTKRQQTENIPFFARMCYLFIISHTCLIDQWFRLSARQVPEYSLTILIDSVVWQQ